MLLTKVLSVMSVAKEEKNVNVLYFVAKNL